MSKKILIACEFSQVVTKAFRDKGHEAYSCDFLPTDGDPKYHIQGNVLDHLNDGWDLMIAHPPCTYLCNSGVWALHRDPSRWDKLDEAKQFFKMFLDSDIPKVCVENPIPHKYARETIGKYTQIVQPWQFGEDASKATCLWLKNLPKLKPTNIIKKKRYANQTPSGRNNIPPSVDRWKLRSVTYHGLAQAMADQWGKTFNLENFFRVFVIQLYVCMSVCITLLLIINYFIFYFITGMEMEGYLV